MQNSESFRQKPRSRSITQAKNELLNDLDSEQQRAENISLQSLLWVYIVLLFVLLFTLPKIYISNQIYYISKDINSKYHKYTALLEENRILKKKIEQLNYERSVLDDVEIP